MDHGSTNGAGSDKPNWRQRLGIGAKDPSKEAEDASASAQPETTPAAITVVKPAPMAPRVPAKKPPEPFAVAPPGPRLDFVPAARPEAPKEPDALADRLKAQRDAAERLAAQRVSAARQRAEARNVAAEPSPLAVSKPPEKRSPPTSRDAAPKLGAAVPAAHAAQVARAVQSATAAKPAPQTPRFSFADAGAAPAKREMAAAAQPSRPPPPVQRPIARPKLPGTQVPPRPASASERYGAAPLKPFPQVARNDYGSSFRPSGVAAALPSSIGRGAVGAPYKSYAQDPASALAYAGTRGSPRKIAYENYRGYPESEDTTSDMRGDPRLGRALAGRNRGKPAQADDIFEDEVPPRRHANANEYQAAYQEVEQGALDERRFASGPWLLMLALLAAAVVTGGIVWFYTSQIKPGTSSSASTENVPVVGASDLPAKTAADGSLGETSANVNKKQIYDRIVGDAEATSGQLASPEVAPMAPESQPGDGQGMAPPDASGQGFVDDPLPLPLPPPPGGSQGRLDQNANQQMAANVTPGAPADDRIESLLLPGGGDQPSPSMAQPAPARPAAPAEPPAASSPTAPVDSMAAPTPESPAVPVVAKPKKKVATAKKVVPAEPDPEFIGDGAVMAPSQQSESSALVAEAPIPAPPPAQSAVKKKKTLFDLFKGDDAAAPQTADSPIQAPAETEVAALPPPAAPPAAAKGYFVQLGTLRSEAAAQTEFARLRSKYPEIVGSLQSSVTKSVVGSSTRYKLGLGPFGVKTEAAKVCSSLLVAGERDCLVRKQ